jgi:predicted HAD superfamily phosphohydrolase
MLIPSYQIHNVLKVYSKQLSQTRLIERQKTLGQKQSLDKINISADAKRQTIIDKVAADIVDRITRSGPQDDVDQEIIDKLEGEIGQSISFNGQGQHQFVFNTIDENNEKTTSTLEVGNSGFLMKRLEQLAKEVVDRNMEQ